MKTPTSDERREVAERLRGIAPIEFFAYKSLYDGICNVIARCIGFDKAPNSVGEFIDRLADLIDPTCHNADDGVRGGFVCSECGYHVEHDTMDADFNAWEYLRYCPHCGARCVDNGGGHAGDD